jgi:hydrogenase expression/formation protein HypD
MTVMRYGLRDVLPANLQLVSGPGCPVCVTTDAYVDLACSYAREGFVVVTFGDMLRVPGSLSSLLEEKTKGADVRIVYSPLDAMRIASANPDTQVLFLAVGFETTAPAVAATMLEARQEGRDNFSVLVAHKLIPPAMRLLVVDENVKVDGFLCPGHVSVITGAAVYRFLAEDYSIPCVIAGFEPVDVLEGVRMILQQLVSGQARVENEYFRAVDEDGNRRARKTVREVFEVVDAPWRGFGVIPMSGLQPRSQYASLDARCSHPKHVVSTQRETGCRCGDILRGLLEPEQCPLFARTCTPLHPIGPCMVSGEGVCSIHYRFRSSG